MKYGKIFIAACASMLGACAFSAEQAKSAAAASAAAAGSDQSTAEIKIEKPVMRWLFGGFGFQNSEASLTPVMDEAFMNERALKTFREISPTFCRVYTANYDCPKSQLDRFADYYDKTFRLSDTTLYVCPGPMPSFPEKMNPEEYADKIAANLEYLIKVRDCRKIRYYCLTNELGSGNRFDYFIGNMELFKKYNDALYWAFQKRGLDIKIIATDVAVTTNLKKGIDSIQWAIDNMDEYVGLYCAHWYVYKRRVDDLRLYGEYREYFDKLVGMSLRKNKRFLLGEYGFCSVWNSSPVMVDDFSYNVRQPETAKEAVLAKLEVGVAAMNSGALGCISWSFCDYPDPFLVEDGHSPRQQAIFEAARCVYRLDIKYNKWGMFRWGSREGDYSAYPELYAMGYLAKLFRSGSTVLPSVSSDYTVRTGAVENGDGTMSVVVINRGGAKKISVDSKQKIIKPLRMYVYEAANVPENKFNDLQNAKCTIVPNGNSFTAEIPAKSACFFTTDYQDRTPAAINGVSIYKGNLIWIPDRTPEHRYYRVYKNGKQIASTVDTKFKVNSTDASEYKVRSVDCWGNLGK